MNQKIYYENNLHMHLIKVCQRPFSTIYKFYHNDRTYGLKIISENIPHVPIELISRSYNNYFKLKNTNGLLKIYDFWVYKRQCYVLMEWLNNHKSLIQYKGNKIKCITQIAKIMKNLIDQNFIDYDSDITNFVIDVNDKIKMIDLDKIIRVDLLMDHYSDWFSSRMLRLISWVGENND